MKSDPTFWLLARATGLTSYVLLTSSVLVGLVLKSRPFGRSIKSAGVTELHRTLALLSLVALALHGLALVIDRRVDIGVGALFVPGLAPYRPAWTGIGVLAGELALLIYASFTLRKLIGVKNWRSLHYLTYLAFAGSSAHGVMTGSDSGQPWAVGLCLGAVGAVTAATAWRVLVPPTRPASRPGPRSTEGAP